jgi:hypothetical protein
MIAASAVILIILGFALAAWLDRKAPRCKCGKQADVFTARRDPLCWDCLDKLMRRVADADIDAEYGREFRERD